MRALRVENRTRDTVLGTRIRLADDLFGRLRGFLLRPAPEPGEGILLSPCQGVHMFGVRYPLDVLFIDESGRILRVYEGLRPWRWTPVHGEASYALELPPGTVRETGTRIGDALTWLPNSDASGPPRERQSPRESGSGSRRTGKRYESH